MEAQTTSGLLFYAFLTNSDFKSHRANPFNYNRCYDHFELVRYAFALLGPSLIVFGAPYRKDFFMDYDSIALNKYRAVGIFHN